MGAKKNSEAHQHYMLEISTIISMLTTVYHLPAKCCLRPWRYSQTYLYSTSAPLGPMRGLIAALAEWKTSNQPVIQPVSRSAGGALLLCDIDLLDNFTAVSSVKGQDKWLTPQWLNRLLGKSRTGSHCSCARRCQCSFVQYVRVLFLFLAFLTVCFQCIVSILCVGRVPLHLPTHTHTHILYLFLSWYLLYYPIMTNLLCACVIRSLWLCPLPYRMYVFFFPSTQRVSTHHDSFLSPISSLSFSSCLSVCFCQ